MCFRAHPHGVVTAAVRGMLNAETQNPGFQLRSTSIQAAVPLRNGQPQASVSRDHVLIHCTTRGESFRATEPRGNRVAVKNVRVVMERQFESRQLRPGLIQAFSTVCSGIFGTCSMGPCESGANGDSSLVRGVYIHPTTIAANDERSGRSSGRWCEF